MKLYNIVYSNDFSALRITYIFRIFRIFLHIIYIYLTFPKYNLITIRLQSIL